MCERTMASACDADISFSHVGIYVTDPETMADFYSRFLAFTVTDRGTLGGASIVFLSRDPREHHQIVLVAGRPADARYSVINQISFRIGSLRALRRMHDKLHDENVSDIQPVTHGNALSVYFRDPEGNRIELFIDTPWYVAQPLRVPMDLSRSDEELWTWVEQQVRTLPGFKSRAEWQADTARRMGLR